jgi:hypothetical protein
LAATPPKAKPMAAEIIKNSARCFTEAPYIKQLL